MHLFLTIKGVSKMDKKVSFCTECEKYTEFTVDSRNAQKMIKGKYVTGTLHICKCKECGALMSVSEYEKMDEEEFYGKYREMMGLLKPSEIKNIREKYGLSQANFAKLLGMGEKTITRYENGAVQDEAHDNLLRAAKSEDFVLKLYKLRKFDFEINDGSSLYMEPTYETVKSNYAPVVGIYYSTSQSSYNLTCRKKMSSTAC